MPGSTLSPTRRISVALMNWLMFCSASFFLNGSLGPRLKGLFNAKLYCYFFNYLYFKIFNFHASQIACAMFAYRNQPFGGFFFAHDKHIWDLFNLSVPYLPTDLFVPEINKPANIRI